MINHQTCSKFAQTMATVSAIASIINVLLVVIGGYELSMVAFISASATSVIWCALYVDVAKSNAKIMKFFHQLQARTNVRANRK